MLIYILTNFNFIIGLVMISVVIVSHECNINPDNVATPIAASLGDLTTIFILAQISNLFYYTIGKLIFLILIY
jgi:solute carrier family 41 member 1